jgi:hypothetical protein
MLKQRKRKGIVIVTEYLILCLNKYIYIVMMLNKNLNFIILYSLLEKKYQDL